MPPPPTEAAPRTAPAAFPAIDMLRALAALLVLGYHVGVLGDWRGIPQEGYAWALVQRGWIGVDLFLVISGFVIAWSALRSHESQGPAFRRQFAERRFWRIAPLYYFTCLIFLFLVKPDMLAIPGEKLAAHVLTHLFFVHNLHPSTFGSINGAAWSVALEMQFYALMLAVTPWLARASACRLLCGAFAVALAYRYLTTLLMPPGTPGLTVHDQVVAATQLPGVIDQFACGIFLALVVRRRQGWCYQWFTVGWRNAGLWLLVGCALLSLALNLHASQPYWERPAMVIFWRPLLTMGLTALVAAAIVFPWASWRLLAPLRYLGEISYGVYLWHLLVLHALMARVPGISGYGLLALVLVGTLSLAAFSWHAFEKPWVRRAHEVGARGAP